MDHTPSTHSHSQNGGPTRKKNATAYLIALQFIHQYYTVLCKCPSYLHRFYSDDSVFVHEMSFRKVAYGQQEIKNHIQSLSLHNCKANIRQVESQHTLGNGVLIQVTGELSHSGEPMRRFMQTFVLAHQKRFYVLNDIFHYQNEGFCEVTKKEKTDSSSVTPPTPAVAFAKPTPASINAGNITSLKVDEKRTQVKDWPVTVSTEIPETTVLTINSLITTSKTSKQDVPREDLTTVANNNPTGPKTFADLFKVHCHKQSNLSEFQAPSSQNSSSDAASILTNRPSSCTGYNTKPNSITRPQASSQPDRSSAIKSLFPTNPRGHERYGRRRDIQGGDNAQRRESGTFRSTNHKTKNLDEINRDRSPIHAYPDANQLFVGNLPHVVTTQDLKDTFSEFGAVADVKIQKRTPRRDGYKVPYFGFVIFECASSAQSAIDGKGKIFLKMPGGEKRRLNVKPKRSQRPGLFRGNNDISCNRDDAAAAAGGRPSEVNRGNFRGSNRPCVSGPNKVRNDHGDNSDNHQREDNNGTWTVVTSRRNKCRDTQKTTSEYSMQTTKGKFWF